MAAISGILWLWVGVLAAGLLLPFFLESGRIEKLCRECFGVCSAPSAHGGGCVSLQPLPAAPSPGGFGVCQAVRAQPW